MTPTVAHPAAAPASPAAGQGHGCPGAGDRRIAAMKTARRLIDATGTAPELAGCRVHPHGRAMRAHRADPANASSGWGAHALRGTVPNGRLPPPGWGSAVGFGPIGVAADVRCRPPGGGKR
ncbi:hypothetical protein Ppa06_70230 [Planomonospora parontospora subsp. parontospora]|uniref:Uncharacterized protein n=2 Tax=Planomonospora parontospora TaxID=58119 RepID=A0AA37F8G2_9ACTN|nr:hypothetical protein GCM10010126_70880 [Planomonospora parontospora]GII13225.1 hypothetical protein Ppa06_70230 [Planomonospora parontospora subsp. parontospora]